MFSDSVFHVYWEMLLVWGLTDMPGKHNVIFDKDIDWRDVNVPKSNMEQNTAPNISLQSDIASWTS